MGLFDDVPEAPRTAPQDTFATPAGPRRVLSVTPQASTPKGGLFDDVPAKTGSSVGSTIDAAVRGAANALTFGFADRIAAGLGAATGIGGERGDYEKNLAAQRALDEANAREHPVATIGGTLAGALAAPGAAAGQATSALRRMAAGAGVGALQGGLSGVGASPDLTNIPEVAQNAGVGFLGGAAIGGTIPAIAPIARGVADASGVPQLLRGFTAPQREADRLVGDALRRDAETRAAIIARRKATGEPMGAAERARLGLTPEEAGLAQEAGVPTVTADLGGEATRRLARAAGNISPEASDILRSEVAHRFEGQSARVADRLSELGGGDSFRTLETLRSAAQKANRPLYAKAYSEGAGGVWTPDLAQLAEAPAVQSAIRDATRTGANYDVAHGFRPVKNPFRETADGRLELRGFTVPGTPGREVGFVGGAGKATPREEVTPIPSLQFWDHVKRNLDDKIEVAKRAGEKYEAATLTTLKQRLVEQLDAAVPSYAEARGTAAKFFGAQDAVEAGQKFVTAKGNNSEYRQIISKMSKEEKALFAHGFMSEIEQRVLEKRTGVNALIDQIFTAPNARERIVMALGPKKAKDFETALHVENVMDQLRTAVTGNSTTAQQLGDVAAHGGILGGALHIKNIVAGMMRQGAKGVNENVMQLVAEGLTSRDPDVYNRALKTIQKSPKLLDVFSNVTPEAIRSAIIAESAREYRDNRKPYRGPQ